ncbi:MAG: hypothetical protein JST19_21990, partial [Bacteroidetes bacterium]|nr:hypothetical protein [Bacteroidota bacterium]
MSKPLPLSLLKHLKEKGENQMHDIDAVIKKAFSTDEQRIAFLESIQKDNYIRYRYYDEKKIDAFDENYLPKFYAEITQPGIQHLKSIGDRTRSKWNLA